MALIQLNELSIGFRGPPLLDGVTCQIESAQRIGLLGRNGSGKTTLMRILSGGLTPDHGKYVVRPALKFRCCRKRCRAILGQRQRRGSRRPAAATSMIRTFGESQQKWNGCFRR